MLDLRAEAAYRQCQIRLDVCRTAPTVLCHFRLIGLSGLGMKNHDLLAAWGCSSCHECVDTTRRGDLLTQFSFAMGVLRTIATLLREGKVIVVDDPKNNQETRRE